MATFFGQEKKTTQRSMDKVQIGAMFCEDKMVNELFQNVSSKSFSL